MSKSLALVLGLAIIFFMGLGGFYWYSNRKTQALQASQQAVQTKTPLPQTEYVGTLRDVTGGKATGTVKVLHSSTYSLVATFTDLPDPKPGFFYEGWLVSSNPLSVVSTGKVELVDGVYTNIFGSGQDYTNHDQYVLTLEPADSDPAPAAHVLEGRLQKSQPN